MNDMESLKKVTMWREALGSSGVPVNVKSFFLLLRSILRSNRRIALTAKKSASSVNTMLYLQKGKRSGTVPRILRAIKHGARATWLNTWLRSHLKSVMQCLGKDISNISMEYLWNGTTRNYQSKETFALFAADFLRKRNFQLTTIIHAVRDVALAVNVCVESFANHAMQDFPRLRARTGCSAPSPIFNAIQIDGEKTVIEEGGEGGNAVDATMRISCLPLTI
jgi:hypothetical protein